MEKRGTGIKFSKSNTLPVLYSSQNQGTVDNFFYLQLLQQAVFHGTCVPRGAALFTAQPGEGARTSII